MQHVPVTSALKYVLIVADAALQDLRHNNPDELEHGITRPFRRHRDVRLRGLLYRRVQRINLLLVVCDDGLPPRRVLRSVCEWLLRRRDEDHLENETIHQSV